ncbi:hypothetical protein F2Q69_00037241 [Brassica cretica]|uniref:Uncharacterized protein n=1 Tax=Brassica cretica TaxID=69181 RepID=A0A8S9SBZ6_BRACR|nr:hypothetical protein F2Q69_00037241 [Brassica cretica]
MHGLMSYRRFGRARSLRSDRAPARPWSLRSDRALARARSLRSDRAEHAFGCCVATLFGDFDVNFVATVFDPNS